MKNRRDEIEAGLLKICDMEGSLSVAAMLLTSLQGECIALVSVYAQANDQKHVCMAHIDS